MKRFDCHTHSHFSLDAHFSVDQLAEAAFRRGLTGIAVTDHADVDYDGEIRVRERMDAAVRETGEAGLRWKGKLEVLRGVEIGQALCNPQATDRTLRRANYDFVLASVHSVPAAKDFFGSLGPRTGPETVADYLKAYLNRVQETVLGTEFDALAHLTYPLRYIRPKVSFDVTLLPFEEQLAQIMRQLADRGRAYEPNLKPFAPDDGQWHEEEGWLLSLYRQSGGSRVTVGTDAHTPDKVGYGLDDGLALLRRTGYDAYTIYRNRQPVMIPLGPMPQKG
jgi:histidinol-phosphatase (PHP family)